MKIKHIISLLSALFIAWSHIGAAPVTIKATLDSAYILMGKQTALNIDIVQDKGTVGHFITNNGDTLTREVEVIQNYAPDTISLSNDREEILRKVIIQSFDSGLYTLPPYVYVVGNDTFSTTPLALKVLPAAVDTLQTIHDYAGVSDPNTKLWDYLPDFIVDYWWTLLIIAFIVLIAAIWLAFFKGKQKAVLTPKKKPIPPYELALQQLDRLKSEKLCENGLEKEYYTRLTEILRTYLDSRFGINAMEMTSSQIIRRLNQNSETKPSAPILNRILEMADFVKFAKVRPLPDENTSAFSNAVKFVEDTKPAPPADENNEEENNDTTTKSTK